MAQLALHHLNLTVTDLPRSLAFYQNLFGLRMIERPPFKGAGAWLACGALQVHLTLYPIAILPSAPMISTVRSPR